MGETSDGYNKPARKQKTGDVKEQRRDVSRLEDLSLPADVKNMSVEELELLADDIRAFLIQKVSATGGHLGPNLGVVELTLALHAVFDSPRDPIIFDTCLFTHL